MNLTNFNQCKFKYFFLYLISEGVLFKYSQLLDTLILVLDALMQQLTIGAQYK